jgi:S-formylglutathione hydrolase FrmB
VPAHYLGAGTLEDGFRAATARWADQVREAGGACVHVEMVSGHDYRMWEAQFAEALNWLRC